MLLHFSEPGQHVVITVVIQHFPKSILPYSDMSLSRATIYRLFKKLGDGDNDAPSKYLQRRMGLEVVDELVEIVGQSP